MTALGMAFISLPILCSIAVSIFRLNYNRCLDRHKEDSIRAFLQKRLITNQNDTGLAAKDRKEQLIKTTRHRVSVDFDLVFLHNTRKKEAVEHSIFECPTECNLFIIIE